MHTNDKGESVPDAEDRICPVCAGSKSAWSEVCTQCEPDERQDSNLGYLKGKKVYT